MTDCGTSLVASCGCRIQDSGRRSEYLELCPDDAKRLLSQPILLLKIAAWCGLIPKLPRTKGKANRAIWESKSVAGWYGGLSSLFGAEKVIFDEVTAEMPAIDMIDIGIGAGRTTKHLAHRCRSYIGLDYSAAMVEQARKACEGRYPILHADARNLKEIPSESADLVLFSFNGIDYVPHEDRLKILREARRICRTGGYFAFSTHNLRAAQKEFAWRGENVIEAAARFVLTRTLNFPLSARIKRDFALLNDGAHRFRLRTYYVQPEEQLRQLAQSGFKSARIFEIKTGKELKPDNVLDIQPYFLCVAG